MGGWFEKFRKQQSLDMESQLEFVPCPICGNNDLVSLSDQGQFKLTCHVKICPKDGMVFLSPRWSKEKYFSFYEKDYDRFYRKAKKVKSGNAVDVYKRIKTISNRMDKHNINNPDWRSVLDIGAGMGWSLEYLRENYPHFTNFYAIEASENCLKHLTEVGIQVLAKDLDEDWGGGVRSDNHAPCFGTLS